MKMKHAVVSSLIAFAGLGLAAGLMSAPGSAVAAPAAAGAYSVDAVHSSVIFKIMHFNTTNFYGRFNNPAGTFDLNFDNPSASAISVSIKTADVDTGNKGRDDHLRQEEFFAAKEYPAISFTGRSFKKTGEKTMEVTGDLTMRGQTRPVTLTFQHTGSGKGRGGEALFGIETSFTIKRSDWGVSALVGPLGDEVTLMIALEGARK